MQPDYIARDEPLLLAMGVGAGLSAIVLFVWLGRIWLLSQRGELDDDPVAFALHDKASLALGAVFGLGFVMAAIGGKLPWL